jgi:hypothetical protein
MTVKRDFDFIGRWRFNGMVLKIKQLYIILPQTDIRLWFLEIFKTECILFTEITFMILYQWSEGLYISETNTLLLSRSNFFFLLIFIKSLKHKCIFIVFYKVNLIFDMKFQYNGFASAAEPHFPKKMYSLLSIQISRLIPV